MPIPGKRAWTNLLHPHLFRLLRLMEGPDVLGRIADRIDHVRIEPGERVIEFVGLGADHHMLGFDLVEIARKAAQRDVAFGPYGLNDGFHAFDEKGKIGFGTLEQCFGQRVGTAQVMKRRLAHGGLPLDGRGLFANGPQHAALQIDEFWLASHVFMAWPGQRHVVGASDMPHTHHDDPV